MNPSDIDLAVDIGREALWVAVKVSFPVLMIGLVVGVIISVLQAATQVQEQTLAFIPKMFVVVATLFLLMPWILGTLVEYTEELVRTSFTGWR